jgi:hypothetical protein
MRLPELIAVVTDLDLLKSNDSQDNKTTEIIFTEEIRFTLSNGTEYDVMSLGFGISQEEFPGYKEINILQVLDGKQVVPNTDRRRDITEDHMLCIMLDKVVQIRRSKYVIS